MGRATLLRLAFAMLAALTVALAGASCLSPTLPLPPPEAPDSVLPGKAAGTWQIVGSCSPGALVTVFDETQGQGVVRECPSAPDAARYVVVLTATKCDGAWVGQELGEQASGRTTFSIQDTSVDPLSQACR